MRYLCVYKPGVQRTEAPSQPDVTEMGKLIEDMSRAGVLLATGGCKSSDHALRVELDGSRAVTSEGQFGSSDYVGGYCLMQVKTKAEAVEWARRFLAITRQGRSELFELEDFVPPAA
ncbi:MAG: YciI family protein [Myxococcota bacterium]